MKIDLFPYQIDGANWLVKTPLALLADEMGLGKTAQAITAADLADSNRLLVLCPAIARVNWQKEFQKFSKKNRTFHLVTDGKAVFNETDSVICSYDLATKLKDQIPGRVDALILDECHFLKSSGSKRSHAVWGKEGLVRRSKRVWALSGTPVPNTPADLWTLLYSFGATRLKYDEYVKRYCNYYDTSHGLQITGAKKSRIDELKEVMKPYILRRRKAEVGVQLPPITYGQIYVERGPVDPTIIKTFAHYMFPVERMDELFLKLKQEDDLLHSTMAEVGFNERGLQTLIGMVKSISTIRRYTGLEKVDAIVKLVDQELEAKAYDKVLIFGVHVDVIEGIRSRLTRWGAVALYGGTRDEHRQRNIDRFQNNCLCRVMIANIKSAGTAINLTAASNVIMVEMSYVPGDNLQAVYRVHRHGQINPVYVRTVSILESIDIQIMQLLKKKMEDHSRLMNDPAQSAFYSEEDKDLAFEFESEADIIENSNTINTLTSAPGDEDIFS